MTKDINLTAPQWLELIFEGKNKEYGAYEIRNDSSNRHGKSTLIFAAVLIVAATLLVMYNSGVFASRAANITQDTEVQLVELDMSTQEVPEENQIQQIEVPPPPLLKETIQFVEPEIAKDEDVKDEQEVLTNIELEQSNAQISVATVEHGSEDGIDIADLKEHQVVVKEEKPQIFEHVEQPPMFPGGEGELMKYLSNNIKYPPIAQEQGIEGRVILRFVVKPDGTVGNVETLRSLDPSCDKEAKRVVMAMPKWNPGKQNGTAVYVYYTLPVLFRLQK